MQGVNGPQGPGGRVDTLVIVARDTIYLTPNQPAVSPLEFQGSGNQVTDPFALEEGLHIVRVTKAADSYFILHLIDNATGKEVGGSLLNEDGSEREVSQAFRVEQTGLYRLNVDNARDAWTIVIE